MEKYYIYSQIYNGYLTTDDLLSCDIIDDLFSGDTNLAVQFYLEDAKKIINDNTLLLNGCGAIKVTVVDRLAAEGKAYHQTEKGNKDKGNPEKMGKYVLEKDLKDLFIWHLKNSPEVQEAVYKAYRSAVRARRKKVIDYLLSFFR